MHKLSAFFSRWLALTTGLTAGLALALAPARPVAAQSVSTYTFSTSTSPYAALAGGTPFVANAGGGSVDDGNSAPLPLGFSFPFAGVLATSVIVNTNGWLTVAPTADLLTINSVLNQNQNQLIAWFGRDLDQTGATLRYLTTGTAPNRVFKVESANFQQFGAPGARGTAQVWLYEGSGRIEVHYGAFNTLFTTPTATITQVGLRGTGPTDVRSLTGTWAAPVAGTAPLGALPLDAANVPVSGAVFRFEPAGGTDILPPVITAATLTPPGGACAPVAHQISVTATDASTIGSATATYTVANGTPTVVNLIDVGGVWVGTIPAQGAALVTWFVTVTDASAQANTASTTPASYFDGAISVNAGPDQRINAGTPVTLTATASPRGALKISEMMVSSFGSGGTSPRPAYLGTDDDLVEISNIGAVPIDLAGYVFDLRGDGTNLARTYTLPAGATLPAGEVLVLHIGTGTDSPANRYYHTGGTNEPLTSGSDYGFLLLTPGGVPVDGVAMNNFAAATGFPAGVWTGAGAPSPGGIAGTGLSGTDTDSNVGWTAASFGARQTIGTYNAGLTAQPLPTVTWSGGSLPTPVTANPLTVTVPATPGVLTYTATLTQNGCTLIDAVAVTVVTPVMPVAEFTASTTTPTNTTVVTFTDQSQNLPSAWQWTFTPATVQFVNGTSATSQNPQVQFLIGGCYTVALTASNPAGSNTRTRTSYVCGSLAYCSTGLQGSPCSSFNGQINSVRIVGTTLSNLNTGCTSGNGQAYTVYPASGSTTATLTAGQTYALTVESSSIGSIGAWLDTNANGTFETSEFILVTAVAMPPTPATSTVTFTVPTTATAGAVGLRIRNGISANSINPGDACVPRFTGETEDYTVTLVSGCAVPAPTITINRPPCVGVTLIFGPGSQPAGTTYAWTGPNGFTSTQALPTIPNVTTAATGTYSLVVTIGGCSSPAGTLAVVINPPPPTPTITVGAPTAAGVLLTSSAPTGNQWFRDGSPIPGATDPTYLVATSAQNGRYAVLAIANDCTSGLSAEQTVIITGLPTDVAARVGLTLAPNPTSDGYLTVRLNAAAQPQPLTVVDALGRVVFRATLAPGATTHSLNLRALPTGVYGVQVLTPTGIAARRLVLE